MQLVALKFALDQQALKFYVKQCLLTHNKVFRSLGIFALVVL